MRRTWGFFGKHYTDGDKVVLDLMLLELSALDTRFETTIYKHLYIDESGKYYQYRGTKVFNVKTGNHYRIECKIKHKKVKGRFSTYIQRLKFLEILYQQ